MNKKKIVAPSNINKEHDKKQKIFSRVRIVLKILSYLISIIFLSKLNIDYKSIIPIFQTNHYYILHLGFIIYFYSWIFGINFDLKDLYRLFSIAPNDGKIVTKSYFFIFVLPLSFSISIYYKSVLFFLIFWILDRILAFHLNKYTVVTINKSKKISTEQFKLLGLDALYDYISRKWIWYRFIIGFILLSTNVILLQIMEINNFDTTFISSILFLTFIVIVEFWIWFERLKKRILINFLLNKQYS